MKLDEATAVLRPRAAWEAVDLGCALVRRHFGKLLGGWLTVALPLWAVIILLCRHSPGWACFLFWWTKPVLTRQPVYFLSRALFGSAPRIGEFWREAKSVLFRGLLPALTYRRLSFSRSFLLPVILLEGQSGTGYRKRADVLGAHGGGQASSLAFAALTLEMVTAVGLVAFVNSFFTEGFEEWAQAGQSLMEIIPQWFLWMLNGFYLLSIVLIEPFYAGAGFALYINSRTHLEGWDIEVAFKRLTSRLTPAITAAAIALLAVFLPVQAEAQEWDAKKAARDSSQTIQEVLKDPAFELDIKKIPVVKEDTSSSTSSSSSYSSTSSSSSWSWPDLSLAGVQGLGYLFILLAVAAAVYFIVRHWSQLRGPSRSTRSEKTGPRVVMGMEVAPESLPEDVPQAAWRLYEAGRHMEALRLLYRGSLSWLIDRASLPVHESDTEGDCLRHTHTLPDKPRAAFFESLTGAWIMCAYAGSPPGPAPMRQFCDAYPFSLRQKLSPSTPAAAAVAAWLVLPLALLVATGCRGGKSTVEYEEKTMGYKNEARINPWLAAEKFLNRTGYNTEVRQVLGAMPDTDTALILPLDSISSRGSAQQMIAWAQRGGHLIVLCSGTDRFRNDWLDFSTTAPGNHEPLLEALDVEVVDDIEKRSGKLEFDADGRLDLSAHDSPALDVSSVGSGSSGYRSGYYSNDNGREEPDILCGDEKEASLASFSEGMGRITLVASGNPFRNRWIGDADNAAILQYLVGFEGASSALFVNASRVNLWQMLMRHAWMPLIAAVLLIALWLWRHMPRLGPALPAPEGNLRHFGSQLDEAGMFLEARGTPYQLLLSARNAVTQAAARRGIHTHSSEFEAHLAARTGIPQEDIVLALNSSHPQHITRAAATLQKLQVALGDNG